MASNGIDELVHLYVEGAFNRRELWKRVTALTGSAAATTAAFVSLGIPETAWAQTANACPADVYVPADAPDVLRRWRPFLQARGEPAEFDRGGSLLRSATRATGSSGQYEFVFADVLRAAR